MVRVRRKLCLLIAIRPRIKQLNAVAGRIPDQFMPPVIQHPCRSVIFQYFTTEKFAGFRLVRRQAIAAIRDRTAGRIRQGRHDILQPGQPCIPGALFQALTALKPHHDLKNSCRALIEHAPKSSGIVP